MKLLCIVSCFRAIETINAPVAMAKGLPRVVVLNMLIGVLVLPVSFYIGARYGGINGVALAWLLTRPFLFAVVTTQTIRVVGVSFTRYLRGLWHPVAGSLVMVAVVFVAQTYLGSRGPLTLLIISALVGSVAYIGYQAGFNTAALEEVVGMWHWLGLPRRRTPGSTPEKEGRVVISEP